MNPLPRAAGVYVITNTVNNHRYVGKSINLAVRQRSHWNDLRRGDHANGHLQRAFRRYGEAAFTFSVLELVSDVSRLLERERYYIKTLRADYNICVPADGNLGMRYSAEAREHFRLAAKRRMQNPAIKAKLHQAMRERLAHWDVFRETHSRAISAGLLSYYATHPDEQRRRQAHRLGVPRTPEVRAKISRGQQGRTASPETRQKLHEALLRRFSDPEERRKHGETQRRRFQRAEERAKSSERAKRQFAQPGMADRLNAGFRQWVDRPESREQMRAAGKARMTPEMRTHLSEKARQRMSDPDARRRIAQSLTGKTQSPETRAKRAASLRAFHARKRDDS